MNTDYIFEHVLFAINKCTINDYCIENAEKHIRISKLGVMDIFRDINISTSGSMNIEWVKGRQTDTLSDSPEKDTFDIMEAIFEEVYNEPTVVDYLNKVKKKALNHYINHADTIFNGTVTQSAETSQNKSYTSEVDCRYCTAGPGKVFCGGCNGRGSAYKLINGQSVYTGCTQGCSNGKIYCRSCNGTGKLEERHNSFVQGYETCVGTLNVESEFKEDWFFKNNDENPLPTFLDNIKYTNEMVRIFDWREDANSDKDEPLPKFLAKGMWVVIDVNLPNLPAFTLQCVVGNKGTKIVDGGLFAEKIFAHEMNLTMCIAGYVTKWELESARTDESGNIILKQNPPNDVKRGLLIDISQIEFLNELNKLMVATDKEIAKPIDEMYSDLIERNFISHNIGDMLERHRYRNLPKHFVFSR